MFKWFWTIFSLRAPGFIILRPRVGLTSFNIDNSAIFSNEKSTVKLSGVSTFCEYAKKL